MGEEFTPRRAVKARSKLKMGIQGPSGSGKTIAALALATNIARLIAREEKREPRVLVIDTENESAQLYADEFEFDCIALWAPFTPERYIQAMSKARGYDVLVIDGISHEWEGDGGILRTKEKMDSSGNNSDKNSWANWSKMTPRHTSFIEAIKQLPVHTICTMRKKTSWAIQVVEGKSKPVKVGLAPIQRDDMEYEFTVVFDLDSDHGAYAIKNRTKLWQKQEEGLDLRQSIVAAELFDWLNKGVDAEPGKISDADRRKLFGALQVHSVSPEDFKEWIVAQMGITKSEDIPASRYQEALNWITSTKETSPDEKMARQAFELLGMTREEKALFIAEHKSDWPNINMALNARIDALNDAE